MTPALQLELADGPALAQARWPLRSGFRIGRAEGSEIELADVSVSRRHLVLEHDADGWTVRDCRSQLGSRLNELPLRADVRAAVHVGDIIAVGPWRFRVAAAAPSPERTFESENGSIDRVDVVAALGSLAERRLELLLRCAEEISAAADEQALADTLAEHALLGSGYTRAAVLWSDGAEFGLRSLRPVAGAHEPAIRFNRALIESARLGEVARIDAVASGAPGDASRWRALCAPLIVDGTALAFLYLDAQRAARRGHTDAPTFVQALTRLAALALSNLRRIGSERERAILAADLERARDVQRRLLPDDRVAVGGLRHALHLHPGRAVAGDIADVFGLADGRIAALLGDVSGAGLGAGLVMASVQSFLRAELGHHHDPARAIGRLNRHLHLQASDGRFVTLWLGIFDPATRECRFVDAGHGHALRLVCGETARPISSRGSIPLGIAAETVFASDVLVLADGEIVVLYSDGVIEQRGASGEPFGRDALVAALAEAVDPDTAVALVLDASATHARNQPGDDDTTLLALGWM